MNFEEESTVRNQITSDPVIISSTSSSQTNLQQLQQQLLILENNPNLIKDENSLSYQTDKIIDNTRRIQLKESTNNALNVKNGISDNIVETSLKDSVPTYI